MIVSSDKHLTGCVGGLPTIATKRTLMGKYRINPMGKSLIQIALRAYREYSH
jgi:hypothetical protein